MKCDKFEPKVDRSINEKLCKEIERLQAENEELKVTHLWKHISELKEQLAKYEVVVEKAIKFCESGSIHHRNQLQEALKELEAK